MPFKHSYILFAAIAIFFAGLTTPMQNFAATLPSGFTETSIAGLSNPTAFAIHPDGRIFVTQQTGALRIIKNGTLLTTPFLTVSTTSSGERGLLGIAFDPNYAVNHFVYVYYTALTPATHNRVSRFTADPANQDVALAGSEFPILDLEDLSATNHNGGAIHFGPDGKLYVAVGENAVPSNAQSLTNRLGKILRINSDGTIPGDNPTTFPGIAGSPTGVNRAIWTVGHRNPFTFAFQPNTGVIFVNDVGQNTWEEIDRSVGGKNYGWPTCEGPFLQGTSTPCSNPNFTDPVYAYSSATASECTIIGGAFYNPMDPVSIFPPEYVGKYFFGDLCAGWIKYIDPLNPPAVGGAANFATGINTIVDIHVANDGSLWYLARGTGTIFRVQFGGTPTPTSTPTSTSTSTFTATATKTPTSTPTATATPSERTAFDYDGDHKADISLFRQSENTWYLQRSQAGFYGAQFGLSTDKITPADFDGDGKTDIAVYRPDAGFWYVLNSRDITVSSFQFGLAEDLPAPADYDGDGKADLAVFRPSTGTWFGRNSQNGTVFGIRFGAGEDKPTVGDFDGDGRSDIALFRPSTGAWYQVYSSDLSIHGENFGFGTDVLVPADYDGDGKTDLAVFRPSDGYWYARNSSDGAFTYKIFGLATDIPAPADFDGDGKADINVYRPSDGTWYRQNSSNGQFIATPFGTNGDKPTMTAFRY